MDKQINAKKVEKCIRKIISFLKNIDVNNWDDFNQIKSIDRDILTEIIDSEVDNMDEVSEVVFSIRFKLSNKEQLKEYLDELVKREEYERCSIISNELKNWI